MSSTPLRRVRSITKKDKINQQASLADPQKLFDLCVELILESYQLAGKAVIHLPHGHAQYLLCLALKRQREGRLSDSSILHKLITSWPYAELSFNFRLNPLVIKNLGSLQPVGHPWTFGCVEPHVYYNICGLSKSRYSSCAREISIGLFNHVYRLNQDGSTPRMKIVDLSDFEQFSSDSGTSYLDTEPPTAPFYQLTTGLFPGRDAYECLSPEDYKFYKAKKPTLHQITSSSHHNSSPIKICVNFKFTSINRITELAELSKLSSQYKLYLRALDVGSMDVSPLESKEFDKLDITELTTLITSASSAFSDGFLAKVSILWLLQNDILKTHLIQQMLNLKGNLRVLFISLARSTSIEVLKHISNSDTNGHSKITALGLFGGEAKNSHSLLGKTIVKLSPSLEYLQLYDWAPSAVPLDSLCACKNLCVLSLIADCSHVFFSSTSQLDSIGKLFKALENLTKLQFIEVGDQIDLQAFDLVQIQNTLQHSLPNIEHFHLNFNYISLKRADLDVKSNQPIFQLIRSFFMTMGRGTSLLHRTSEHFHLTLKSLALGLTKRWLTSLRQNVCFKVGSENNTVSSLSHLRRLGM